MGSFFSKAVVVEKIKYDDSTLWFMGSLSAIEGFLRPRTGGSLTGAAAVIPILSNLHAPKTERKIIIPLNEYEVVVKSILSSFFGYAVGVGLRELYEWINLIVFENQRPEPEYVTMNIWFRGGINVGHAAVDLNIPNNPNSYISWWPGGNHTYHDDVQAEGRDPDESVAVFGLDKQKILRWWARYQNNNNNVYHFLRRNCSSVSIEALDVGGASYFWEFWRIRCFYRCNSLVVWTPHSAHQYCQDTNSFLMNWLRGGSLFLFLFVTSVTTHTILFKK